MKRGNPLKIIIGVLLVVALMSATAFAATGQPESGESKGISINLPA